MQSLKHAFRFICASLNLVFSPPRLLKPWQFLLFGGMGLLTLGLLPLGLVIGLIGLTPLGLALIGFLCAVILIVLLIWGEITTLTTCVGFANQIQQGISDPSQADPIKKHWRDVLALALTMPTAKIIHRFKKRIAPDKMHWLDTHHLLIPIISLEDHDAAGALARLKTIIDKNLIRFQPQLIRVGLVGWATWAVLTTAGIVLGFLIGLTLADPQTASTWQQVLGAVLSGLTAWLLTILGLAFNTCIRACYHSALFVWVTNVEEARASHEPNQAAPPEILQQTLGQKSINNKEREHAAKT